jgi:hypothetical protein
LAIIGLYLLLGGLYMWAVPPFEGPDEPQHMAYIRWLAEGNGFPPQGDEAWETPIQQEAGQSPLYYLIASIPARAIDLESPEAEFRSNPHAFTGVWPRSFPDNDNRAIHHPSDAKPLAGGWLALYSARAISLIFGVLLVVSTYGLGRQVAPDDPKVAIAAALLLAVTPQVIFISSVASNDIPAAAFSALMLWLLARMVQLGLSAKRALPIGIVYGLAILTKSSAAALGLVIAVALLWFWLSRRNTLRQVIWAGLWLTLGMLASVGWWLARSWILYRSPLGLSTHDLTPWAVQDPATVARALMRWLHVFRSYWIALGWGTIRPEGELLYVSLLSMALMAAAGLVVLVVGIKERLGIRPVIRPILIVILLVAIVGVAISLELWMHRVIAPYGRLMFPAAAAISVLLVSGWYTLHRRLPFIVAGFVAVIAVSAPFLLMRPAFTPPELLSKEIAADIGPGLGIRFGPTADEPVAELLSATTLDRSPEPVDGRNRIPVELCWRAFEQTESPISVLVHIIGPEEQLIAQRRTYPGLGHYPTTIWQPDGVFCDVVRVLVWDYPPETLAYRVEVALLDMEIDERLQAFDPNGYPLPVVFADRVRLPALPGDSADQVSPAPDGATVQMLEATVNQDWVSGQAHRFSVTWGLNRSIDNDYQVFVHLRDMASGNVIAQADGPPLDGWFPTSWWIDGEVVVDERTFDVPADLAAGAYDLVVGFYDLDTLEQIGDTYDLGNIEVTR